MAKSVHDFTVKTIRGDKKSLADYSGKVLLVVNVASECGLTPQYDGLEKLYEQYKDKGLVILGFPANDFGAQEPGTDAQVESFCTTKFGVKFPMFSKVSVKGGAMDPLFDWLQSTETNPQFGGAIKWNFNKFLVGKDGKVIGRFEPKVEPLAAEVTKAIEAVL
jgi:glutathione peroxidase